MVLSPDHFLQTCLRIYIFFFHQRIALQFKANLENLTNVRPDEDDFRWYLKVGWIRLKTLLKPRIFLLLTLINFFLRLCVFTLDFSSRGIASVILIIYQSKTVRSRADTIKYENTQLN